VWWIFLRASADFPTGLLWPPIANRQSIGQLQENFNWPESAEIEAKCLKEMKGPGRQKPVPGQNQPKTNFPRYRRIAEATLVRMGLKALL
jgi:hypothetical protein